MRPDFDRRRLLQLGSSVVAGAVFPAATEAIEPAKPTPRILAIGGGGFPGRDHDPLLLKYLVSLTEKKNPRICFLPTAGADQAESIVTWYEVMNDLECRPRHLRLINNSSNLKNLDEQLLAMDAIFVGGGNTLNMLAVWKAQGVDVIVRKAWEQGIVLAGVSAGMICWFEQGVSDSRPERLSCVGGLGFLKGSACPHYDHKDRTDRKDRQEAYVRLLLADEIKDGYACDDGVGLLYERDQLVRIVGDRPKAGAFAVRRAGDRVIEERLQVDLLGVK